MTAIIHMVVTYAVKLIVKKVKNDHTRETQSFG